MSERAATGTAFGKTAETGHRSSSDRQRQYSSDCVGAARPQVASGNNRKRSREYHGTNNEKLELNRSNYEPEAQIQNRSGMTATQSPAACENDNPWGDVDDQDIFEIDEAQYATTTPQRHFSSVMKSAVTRVVTLEKGIQHNKRTDIAFRNQQEATEISNPQFDPMGSDESDENNNAMLSLDQLTQEEVDITEMFDLEQSSNSEHPVVSETNDGLEVPETEGEQHTVRSMELKQPTLSQYYTKDENPTRRASTIANYMEYNGHHFMRGDVWQLKAMPSNSKNPVFGNMIVKIKDFKTENKKKVARIDNAIYLPLQNIPELELFAQSVIDSRRSKGNLGPEYVEYILPDGAVVPRIPLDSMKIRRTDVVTSDLLFGYEKNGSMKEGYFFKSKETASSNKKHVSIPMKNGQFTGIDLYAGAGGMGLGLEAAGFQITHHVDNDTAACSTLQAKFPDATTIQSSMEDFLTGCQVNPNSKRYPKVGDHVLCHGSPPCQGFSKANRNGGANDAANNAETSRFVDFEKYFQHPFVVFENVEGIDQNKHKRILQGMVSEFLKMDYQVRVCHLLASDYGDPQDRQRFFILASKTGLVLPVVPKPTHGDCPSLTKKRTVADAIGFLEQIPPLQYEGEISVTVTGREYHLQGHVLRSSERNKDDIQLVADSQSPTVLKKRVIRHYKCGKRPLTRLEQQLLQSFPLSFKFNGTDSEIRDQIGNAVPFCLSAAIGKSVMEAIRTSRALGRTH